LVALIGRYVHAKQFKRMKKAMRRLRTRVGRVHCEVQRQLHTLPGRQSQGSGFAELHAS
jgi:transposase, IS5 family